MLRSKSRFIVMAVAFVAMFVLLVIRMYSLAVTEAEVLVKQSEAKTNKTVTIKGSRGTIMDANGLPVAYDKRSYNIDFYRDYSRATSKDRAAYTGIIIKTIEIVGRNGGTFLDSFAIRRDPLTFAFDFEWGDISPEAAVEREKNWRTNMNVGAKATPEEIYLTLRERYQIPDDVSYEDAVLILSVWQEVQLSAYRAYLPVTVATDVSINTVAEIETRSLELDGMTIDETSTRIYPHGAVAAHVIGYMGRIGENSEDKYKEMGYDLDNDKIGVLGVENTMELELSANLKARQGYVMNEVSSNGTVLREIETVQATDGNSIQLTINLDMQQRLEQALAQNISLIREEQISTITSNYDKYNRLSGGDIDSIRLATYGAAVVMEVKTGRMLAMANYPSFDLNLFTGGISPSDYKALLEDKGLPLFNKAISSKGMPGSIFKMVTGLAGLMEGAITVNETIQDEGVFDKYTEKGRTAPACWKWNTSRTKHGAENIINALKDSCNYYFFTVADELTIDRLANWGGKLGLSTKTNIELPGEVVGQIGGQKVLYDYTLPVADQKTALPTLVLRSLEKLLKGYREERDLMVSDDQIKQTAQKLIQLVGTGENTEYGDQIRQILYEDMGISRIISKSHNMHGEISSLLTEIEWNPNQTVRSGIGQGIVSVTPIAVARYVAALVNGGNVLQPTVIDKIIAPDGKIVKQNETKVVEHLEIPQEYMDAIKEGMKKVVSEEDGGTAGQAFEGFEYKDDIGGKTGSAQISSEGYNIDIENTSWFVCFAPLDDPEIVMVVYIPYGMSGTKSAHTVKEFIRYYMDQKEGVAQTVSSTHNELPKENSLIVN
ncbi:MAG: penicillin-binding transpeptidase domain-containing protein [Christensenellales bacterium]